LSIVGAETPENKLCTIVSIMFGFATSLVQWHIKAQKYSKFLVLQIYL
jgi:hypothetical protein